VYKNEHHIPIGAGGDPAIVKCPIIIIERKEIDKRVSDQGWRQLQTKIERFLEESLRGDGWRLEYKPRFIIPLLEMFSEHPQKDEVLYHSRRLASGILGKKGEPSKLSRKRSMEV
jgi:hypothetical protein